jgi:hypothetical protein
MSQNIKFNKALIISRDSSISGITQFILSSKIRCLTMRSAPDAKYIFKASDATRVLILDWSLQDKYNSIFKCLVEAKSRKKIFVVNIFNSNIQKKWIYERLPKLKDNNKIYTISNELLSISLIFTLMKVRKRLISDLSIN